MEPPSAETHTADVEEQTSPPVTPADGFSPERGTSRSGSGGGRQKDYRQISLV